MTNRLLIYLLPLLAAIMLCGCGKQPSAWRKTNWEVELAPDKKPYDLYLADKTLSSFFPEAKVQSLSRAFKYTNMDNKMKDATNGTSLMIMGGLDFYLTAKEWQDLVTFARNGNEILILCSVLDAKIEHTLSCRKHYTDYETYPLTNDQPGADNKNVLTINNLPGRTFGHEGRSLKGYFTYTALDTLEDERTDTMVAEGEVAYLDKSDITGPEVLGTNVRYGANMLRYKVGAGHITLHAAPLMLTNYFLLQPGNIDYLSAVWSTFPANITCLYLNEYQKRDATDSDFSVLWRYKSTKLALLLAMLALALYVLFEGKRKQRIIPVIPPIKNESVSFVETVGRLYYNKGKHANLAEKMMQQFLEWVRVHYYLNTNQLNEHFIYQLTIKSGQQEATVRGLLDMIHEIKLGDTKIDDAYLYQFYNTIQQFYKNNRI